MERSERIGVIANNLYKLSEVDLDRIGRLVLDFIALDEEQTRPKTPEEIAEETRKAEELETKRKAWEELQNWKNEYNDIPMHERNETMELIGKQKLNLFEIEEVFEGFKQIMDAHREFPTSAEKYNLATDALYLGFIYGKKVARSKKRG